MKIVGFEPKDNNIKLEDIYVDVHYDRHQKLYSLCLRDKNTQNILSDYQYAKDKKEAQFTKSMMQDDIRNYLDDSYNLIETVNEELLDRERKLHYFTSPYEVKNYLINQSEPQRIWIDDKLGVYLVGDANETIHTSMINIAKEQAVLPPRYFLNDYDKNQVAVIFYPKTYHYDESDFDLDYAIEDDYDYKYIYDDFVTYSRYKDFDDFKLANVLGDHEKKGLKLKNPNGYTLGDMYVFESLSKTNRNALKNDFLSEDDKSINQEIKSENTQDFNIKEVYHCRAKKDFNREIKDRIIWFSEDLLYSLNYGENIFTCNLSIHNPFDVGNTDLYIRGLIPTQFSKEFIDIANRLDTTPEELLKFDSGAKRILSIVGTVKFGNLVKSKGYDGITSIEDGNRCYAVFNLDQVEEIDRDIVEENLEEEMFRDERGKKVNITSNVSEVANMIINNNTGLRILYDDNIKQYMVCDVNDFIHMDMMSVAIENYFYPPRLDVNEYNKWGYKDEAEDEDKLFFLIYIPKGKEEEIWGYKVEDSQDDYDTRYNYDFGYIVSRGCDFTQCDLYYAFDKPNSITELDGLNKPITRVVEDLNPQEQKQLQEIDELINDLYKLRQQSIQQDGEFGVGNLVFKEMRNMGYLDNLKNLKRRLQSKEMSLEKK